VRGRSVLKIVLVAAVAAGLVVVAREAGIAERLTPERLREFVRAYGMGAPFVYMGLYTLRGVILVIPASVLSLAGGLAFGPALGTVYTVIGATGGAVLSYLLARWLGRGFVERVLKGRSGRFKAYDEGAARSGFSVVFVARLIPLIPFDVISFGAGLSGIPFGPFALGTLLGIIPGSFAYNFLGDSFTDVGSSQFILALLVFALIGSVPLVWRWVTKRGTRAHRMQSEAGDGPTARPKALPPSRS
jgi:uncharacterized membrane protein YdjX (TVP38/TMEM64 family)